MPAPVNPQSRASKVRLYRRQALPFEARPVLMVVEDDGAIGPILSDWVEEQGFRTLLMSNTQDACEALGDMAFIEVPCDGLLVDYRLPDGTGAEVIQAYDELFPEMPIAMMTAFADERIEDWLQEIGAQFFRKPLDLDALSLWLGTLRAYHAKRKSEKS